MRDSILNFANQFEFEPVIQNIEEHRSYRTYKKYLVCGMGGSHLAGDLIKLISRKSFDKLRMTKELDIVIHSDYGLREVPDLKDRLVIVSSYSGDTEEEIDNFNEARKRKLRVAVVAAGGELIRLAKRSKLPFVELPSGVQPRMAIGYSLLGILKLMGHDSMLKKIRADGLRLQPAKLEGTGKSLAKKLVGRIPIIYSSVQNKALAYYWKITLNETGKTPAFSNVFPELNHNEMQGFAVKELSDKFSFIFLEDPSDHPRIQKRMKVLKEVFQKRYFPVEMIRLAGVSRFQTIFNSMFYAAWTAYHLAKRNHLDPEHVPLIEEFKKKIFF